jgi:pilus assembly protein Flp/PilA
MEVLGFFWRDHAMDSVLRFLRDETGATMVEYGLIVAALGAATITVLHSLSSKMADVFNILADAIK